MKNFIHHDIPQIKQVNLPTGRVYETPNGNKYPSVTSIMSWLSHDSIMEWRNRVGDEEANKISSRASGRGTRIHSLCEEYLLDKKPNPGMFDIEMFNSLKPYLDKIDNIHALETRLFSHKLEIAGTVDCICEYDGNLTILDFKTSTRVKTIEDIPSYFLQCSAYSYMFWELTGILAPKLTILMGVDNDNPIIHQQPVKPWLEEFIRIRTEYKKTFGK